MKVVQQYERQMYDGGAGMEFDVPKKSAKSILKVGDVVSVEETGQYKSFEATVFHIESERVLMCRDGDGYFFMAEVVNASSVRAICYCPRLMKKRQS